MSDEDACDPDLAGRVVDVDVGDRGDVGEGVLVLGEGDAPAWADAGTRWALARRGTRDPPGELRHGGDHGVRPRVAEVALTELDGVGRRRGGQFVHERLVRVRVLRRAEAPEGGGA